MIRHIRLDACTCGMTSGEASSVPCPVHDPGFRFYNSHNGREVTAEEAASAARAEAPEMVKRALDGAVHGRSGRCL
jgi:hypothetical protein